MSESQTKKRLEETRQKTFAVQPEKYILKIQTPRKAYIVEGRKDFSLHNNREATMTAWFEFLLALAKCQGGQKANNKYRLNHFPPLIASPKNLYGMIIEHSHDGTICFGGRVFSNCSGSSEETTTELIYYFEEINKVPDEEVKSVLQTFGFGIYDL